MFALTTKTVESEPPAEEAADEAQTNTELIAAELLVEDVSIDGMCGVY